MTTAAPARIAAGTWTSDPVHSVAGFRVRHFGINWLSGGFNEFEVTLTTGDAGTKLEGSAKIESISFPNEQLHGHLMSPDFFDVQLHPTATFESSDVQLAEDGTATVNGTLTIKGTALPVTLTGTWSGPVEGMGGEQRIGLELSGEIDRDAYGVSWAATLATGQEVVAKAVKIDGSFELVQQ